MNDPSIARPQHRQWLLALGGWTFFVWFQRIGNVVSDDELEGFARGWRLVVAAVFVMAGVALVGAVIRTRRRPQSVVASRLGLGLAVVGSCWWLVRSAQILLGDWDGSFKLVHTVLAAAVVALSVMVWRTRGYDRPSYG